MAIQRIISAASLWRIGRCSERGRRHGSSIAGRNGAFMVQFPGWRGSSVSHVSRCRAPAVSATILSPPSPSAASHVFHDPQQHSRRDCFVPSVPQRRSAVSSGVLRGQHDSSCGVSDTGFLRNSETTWVCQSQWRAGQFRTEQPTRRHTRCPYRMAFDHPSLEPIVTPRNSP